jgi:toluene monooxygenase system protein A
MDRESWLPLAQNLDWTPSYVREEELFPEDISGGPWLHQEAWAGWAEPFRTTFAEYARTQAQKEEGFVALCDALNAPSRVAALDPGWNAGVKLHSALLTLAEFAAVIGNLRAARFGRQTAWRATSLLGALDELRHTQLPLALMHDRVRRDAQADFTHRLYHTRGWVSIAARHAFDELLLASDPIEFAIATHFVLETGFTNLQFVGLAALADSVGDPLFKAMLTSIQTDEARHAQVGRPVLEVIVEQDRERAQYLVDKWFWRNWQLFAVVTGFTMDYLTPVRRRGASFKEFVEEWVLEQYVSSLGELGLQKPWYWDIFLGSLDHYHHNAYAAAYTYRASVWFDMVLPGPEERAWLARKYPGAWDAYEPIWDRITSAWRKTDPGLEFAAHATAIPCFCALCQMVLAHGTPAQNAALVVDREPRRLIFCSEPCRWIFEREPERYIAHKDVVARVLAGEAPGNLLEFLTRYSGLSSQNWGKDAFGGVYPWLHREAVR